MTFDVDMLHRPRAESKSRLLGSIFLQASWCVLCGAIGRINNLRDCVMAPPSKTYSRDAVALYLVVNLICPNTDLVHIRQPETNRLLVRRGGFGSMKTPCWVSYLTNYAICCCARKTITIRAAKFGVQPFIQEPVTQTSIPGMFRYQSIPLQEEIRYHGPQMYYL